MLIRKWLAVWGVRNADSVRVGVWSIRRLSLMSFNLVLGLASCMSIGCGSALADKPAFSKEKDSIVTSDALSMPSLKDFEKRDEYVVGLRAHVDCLGIAGISGLPDGWEIASKVKGESVDLSLKLEEVWLYDTGSMELNNMQSEVAKIRIHLLFRGQWSDCMGWRLEIDTVSKSDKAAAKKNYKAMELKTYRYKGCSSDRMEWCLLPDETEK